MNDPTLPRCPICGAPVIRSQTKTFPFCTPRCQQIDLGRWLGESYGVPKPDLPLDDLPLDDE